MGIVGNNYLSPWPLGSTSPAALIGLVYDNNQQVDLTGEIIGHLSLLIYSVAGGGIYTKTGTGAGTFAIVQNKPAIVQYTWNSTDIPTTAGNYALRVQINWGGTSPQAFDYIPWTVQA